MHQYDLCIVSDLNCLLFDDDPIFVSFIIEHTNTFHLFVFIAILRLRYSQNYLFDGKTVNRYILI